MAKLKQIQLSEHSAQTNEQRKKLLKKIDSINGVRVVFYTGEKIHELRPHSPQ